MDLLAINSMVLALECGALTKSDAISWADTIIQQQDVPDERLFDVSLSKNIYDVISHLKKFGQYDNPCEVSKRAFTLFAKGLEDDKTTYEMVTRKLYDMAFTTVIPSKDVVGLMMCFWDELNDAKLGIYGDIKTVKKECLEFLYEHGS